MSDQIKPNPSIITIWTGREGTRIIREAFENEFNKYNMRRVAGWMFMYNEFTGNWQAAKREDSSLLYNDIKSSKVLKSKNLDTLIDIIRRTGGNSKEIKSLLK